MPLAITAATTTPRHSTNARNGTSSASAIVETVVRPRANPCTPSTTAPASAAHAGDNPNTEVTANPISVSASTASVNSGTLTSLSTESCVGALASSRAKTQRHNANSVKLAASQGDVIPAVEWRNDHHAALKGSTLVR